MADNAGISIELLSRKLDEVLVGQNEAREERAQLREGQQETRQEVGKLSAHVRDGMELLQGGLGDLAREQMEASGEVKETLEKLSQDITVSREEAQEAAAKTLGMLSDQSAQLARLGETTAATFTALKSLSEHENDVPRLVTITLKGAPEWKGAWHDNIGSNLLRRAQKWVGTHSFFQLHFLCEKTLLPVADEPGYELEMPREKFAEFMATAGPILSATCAVLKLVTLVGRPVAKIAGIDLPQIGSLDMDSVRHIKLGESTVGQAFEGTGIAEMLDRIEALSPADSAGAEPEPEPQPAGGEPEPEPEQHGTDLLDFADNAIAQVESLASWAGVPLQEEEDQEKVHAPAERLRTSVDTIKQWIHDACQAAVPSRDSDLGNHTIGGLQKTVMADGETLWLSAAARAAAADGTAPAEGVPGADPQRYQLLVTKPAERTAEHFMLSTTASCFAELRDKVLACRLCEAGHDYTISVVARGEEPAAFESLEQLPEPKTVRGVRKVSAKLQVARAD
eukprot:COSAG04_NODE_1572_length_6292_cov_6.243178_6_plen_509_part_00